MKIYSVVGHRNTLPLPPSIDGGWWVEALHNRVTAPAQRIYCIIYVSIRYSMDDHDRLLITRFAASDWR